MNACRVGAFGICIRCKACSNDPVVKSPHIYHPLRRFLRVTKGNMACNNLSCGVHSTLRVRHTNCSLARATGRTRGRATRTGPRPGGARTRKRNFAPPPFVRACRNHVGLIRAFFLFIVSQAACSASEKEEKNFGESEAELGRFVCASCSAAVVYIVT